MEIPASLSERFPFLDTLEEDWEPVSRPAFFGWLAFYVLLIGNALFGGHLFQWFDLVFIPIHEGGHLLFRMFGEWIMVAGGTFLIDSIGDRDARTLRLLQSSGITPGARMRVKKSAAAGYSVRVGRSTKSFDLSREVAHEIRILPVTE